MPYHFDIEEQIEEPRVQHSTKASRMGEFMQEGKWRLTGRFIMIPPVTFENGRWVAVHSGIISGEIIGEPKGENFLSCYFCGTSINDHLTFTDRDTGRQVNIGNVCVEHIYEATHNRDFAVNKGLESLKSKVVREFKKRVHRKDLLEFLDVGIPVWQKEINDKVDAELKTNEHAFWNPPTRTVTKNDKIFELQATLWEQKDGAQQREYNKRNPIKIMRDEFDRMGWNASPMIQVFQDLIKTQGFDIIVPKPRKLTNEEQLQLTREVQVHVDDYLKHSKESKN